MSLPKHVANVEWLKLLNQLSDQEDQHQYLALAQEIKFFFKSQQKYSYASFVTNCCTLCNKNISSNILCDLWKHLIKDHNLSTREQLQKYFKLKAFS